MTTPRYSPSVFSDMELEKYAEVLLWGLSVARKNPFKKSDLILVRYDVEALPLAEAVTGMLHDMGRIPVVRSKPSTRMEYDFYRFANNKRLTFDIPGDHELYSNLNGLIHLLGPSSRTHLATIDPEQLSIHTKALRPLRLVLDRREELGEFGSTLGLYPTPGLADLAGLSLEEYTDQVRKACGLGAGTPVTQWKLFQKHAAEIVAWLNGLDIRSLRVQSERCDLLMAVGERRTWVALTGRNIPSFECYTSPDWRSVEGVYYADQPTYAAGTRVRGIRLEFRMGEALDITAEEGQANAITQLTLDQGANKVGEFALVDKRFSPIDRFMANTLYDENYGGAHGSCHVALGQSYTNAYAGDPAGLDSDRKHLLGFNTSALHWDLVNTEDKRVTATLPGGEKRTIYENGQFTL
jgi:aminopeptidase